MDKRDWQKDWEIASSIPLNVRVVDTGKDLEVIGVRNQDDKQRQAVATWFMYAKDRWPAALEERARLEKRVRELEKRFYKLKKILLNAEIYVYGEGPMYLTDILEELEKEDTGNDQP